MCENRKYVMKKIQEHLKNKYARDYKNKHAPRH